MVHDWQGFWNGAHRIYVNDRHRAIHYDQVARDIISELPRGGESHVLDFGCGEALQAEAVAAACARLWLADSASIVVAGLRRRFVAHARVGVLEAGEMAAIPDHSLDLVVVNSVAQYLSPAELDGRLTLFHHKLRPGGRLVLADILPPREHALTDAMALLRLAARERFLKAAILGLAATFLSDYRRLRHTLGLTRYAEGAMLAKLAAAGFRARRRPLNFGFNQRRMTFVATPV